MTGMLRDGYDGLLADLDGVVYVGPSAVPAAVPALTEARAAGLAVGYVTNNANRPPEVVSAQLRDLGLSLDDHDVVTSAQIAAALVRERFGAGARVLAVGGPGVRLALQAEGLEAVQSAESAPVAVVQGYGPDVGWRDLAEAAFAIHGGAHWVATNTDLTIPQPRGIAPGNGTLVAAVQQAVGVAPQVAGKPQAVAFSAAATRLGCARPLVLGDRLDTDIEGANAAGMDSLFVLTGVHGYPELAAAPAHQRPTHIAADLAALSEPVATTVLDAGAAVSGATRLEVVDGRITRRSGTDPVEAIRAALALVWAAPADPPELAADLAGLATHRTAR